MLAGLLCFFAGGCSHSGPSSAYGNLPVGKPGPANAVARSIPTLTAAQRQQVMIRKFGNVAATQSPNGSN
jgi:hypothetical protein